ncbi:FAD-dependent pyridine nucleotide-disulfide oxidoreductase [Nitzschia inconspicua]|uniref:FAD-dependent pyridine nucleotide-disulfide oxidoreductase n=1 Tax=Nitzschia inconspicua TaxID=303405 RepID=A0A9K3Q2P3_9STRA|nr:FAD-dependent pyridine nucleotide-disulfide oxidoreductase [Nitzschia inconspicua]
MTTPICRWRLLVAALLSSPGSLFSEALVTAGRCAPKTCDSFQLSMAWSGSNNYLEQLEMITEWDVTAASNPLSTHQQEIASHPQTEPHIEKVLLTESTKRAEQDDQEMQRYLHMLSTEVDYKKLLNQNPYALTDIDFPIIVGRVLDTLEDSTQKSNGKLKGQAKLKGKKEPRDNRPTVVVLGTGWAAHAFVKAASTYDLRVVVVSPVNHFVFTPMLASAAVGTIEYRSMTEPIRVTNPFIDNFVEGRAVGVDVRNKVVRVQLTSLSTVTGIFKGIAANAPCRLEPEEVSTEGGASKLIELNYDYLVCAVGTSVRSSIVPGAKEFCFNLKTSQDSKRLRTAILEALEYASRPTCQEEYYPDDLQQQQRATIERRRRVRFAIVGGGPTGVELAGEMCDFFSQVCSKPNGAYQHLANDVEVLLIHGGNDLLPAMDRDLRERALTALRIQGVKVILNTRLEEVGQDFITIKEKGAHQTETIPVGLTVWAAGNAPVPFVSDLLSQLPESAAGSAGRINVDRWLRCPTPTPETFGSILVLGDVACLGAKGKYDPEKVPLPQTAQVAGQQGAFAARMLNRRYDLKQTPPRLDDLQDETSLLRSWLVSRGLETAPEFTFLNLGYLAYVGGGEALNQVKLGDVPLFNYSGKVAFALWRTVYLAKQAATRNQALIAFDWLRTELFGRDITRL